MPRVRQATMREERRTYRRQRCTYWEPSGWCCRNRPSAGRDRCLLHAEPAEAPST